MSDSYSEIQTIKCSTQIRETSLKGIWFILTFTTEISYYSDHS